MAAGEGVEGHAADGEVVGRLEGRAAVYGRAGAVQDAPDEVGADGHLGDFAAGADRRVGAVEAAGAAEDLHDHPVALDFEHLTPARLAVRGNNVHQLVVADLLSGLGDQERPRDVVYGLVVDGEEARPAVAVAGFAVAVR